MIAHTLRKLGPRKILCLLLDLCSFLIGAHVASLIGGHTYTFDEFTKESSLFLGAIIFTLVSFRYHNLYKNRIVYSNLRQIMLLWRNFVFTFLAVLVLQFFFRPQQLQPNFRVHVAAFVFVSYALVVFHRFLLFRMLTKGVQPSQLSLKNAVAIGAGGLGASTARKLKNHLELGYNLVGFIDDDEQLHNVTVEGVEVCGGIRDLPTVTLQKDVEEIFITINDIDHEDLFDIIEKCKGVDCPINVVSNHFDVVERKVNQAEFDELRFVTMFPRPNSLYQTTIKRILDVVCASLIVLVLSPVLLFIAFLIKLTSKGPVLYVPMTIGKDGNEFRFHKFRSMYDNVSDRTHRALIEDFISGKKKDGMKLQGDSRITAIGKFIRKYSLDEFPQLLNVIKGEMSLVGPRPSTRYEYDQMENWHKRRYAVLPGMTGLWQVSGRSEVSFKDMIMMDIYYVENCSFWLDVDILMKTVRVVFSGVGGH